MIHLSHIADLKVFVGHSIDVGETLIGTRRIIPITGGEVTGPRLRGRILAGGADFQVLRPDHMAELHALVLELAAKQPLGAARRFVAPITLLGGPRHDARRLAFATDDGAHFALRAGIHRREEHAVIVRQAHRHLDVSARGTRNPERRFLVEGSGRALDR